MVSRGVVLTLVVVVLAAGAGSAGYYAGTLVHGTSPNNVVNSTLSILAAGTLNGALFPSVADALVNETPGISAPSAAQLYEGSLAVVNAISTEGAVADVAAVADYRLIANTLEPSHASWEVVFGATPEVLAYDPSLSAFSGINSSNWGTKLIDAVTGPSAVKFGVWNAETDPNGYNEIFSLILQGEIFGSGASSVYGTFYTGAPGTQATPNSATTTLEASESTAATLVSTGVVCAVITYRSYAVVHHMSYVSFNSTVGLEATDHVAVSLYKNVTTTIPTSTGGTAVVTAAPILFAATVPADATNPALGAAFLHLLLSPQGSAILGAGGAFDPIFPGWTDQPSAVPSVLAPDVVAMPSLPASYLT